MPDKAAVNKAEATDMLALSLSPALLHTNRPQSDDVAEE